MSNQTFRTTLDLSVRHAGLIIKKGDEHATEFGSNLSNWLAKKNIEVTTNQIHPNMNILIILGGDGTLLRVAERAARHSIPVVGINLGHLGFLTEIAENETHQALDEILNGAITVENRMMLSARIRNRDQISKSLYALNEVVISKGTLDRVLQLNTMANQEFITTYKADGLIFSTPTGSTAYNLSAGGPLVYPGLASILVTPICPFMLGSRPVLLPADILISTSFDNPAQAAKIIIDGRPAWDLSPDDQLEIQTAGHPLQLIISPHKDYFAILRNKLHWGSGK